MAKSSYHAQAVKKANEEIGFQTIPALSLRYISDFKANCLKRLLNYSLQEKCYREFSKDGSLTDKVKRLLPSEDYEILTQRFFSDGLYKSIIGEAKFAKCFITSEYLYAIFKSTATVSFDYSAVLTGYYKSIELLLDKIKELWLDNADYADLWIAGRVSDLEKKSEWCRRNPEKNAKGMQVRFKREYESHFLTEMGPLTWLLHDNNDGWYISDEGKDIVHSCLWNYNQGCRNEHLHKDIICYSDGADMTTTIEVIRDNTILCLFYLIGGCKLTGKTTEDDACALAVENDSYERLYKTLLGISKGVSCFYIQFSDGKQIKAFRRYDQERTRYDKSGRIESVIRFVVVNEFSEIGTYDTDDEYLRVMESKPNIEISRNNMPARLWWYNSFRGKNEVKW